MKSNSNLCPIAIEVECVFTRIIILLIIMFVIIRACQGSARFKYIE